MSSGSFQVENKDHLWRLELEAWDKTHGSHFHAGDTLRPKANGDHTKLVNRLPFTRLLETIVSRICPLQVPGRTRSLEHAISVQAQYNVKSGREWWVLPVVLA